MPTLLALSFKMLLFPLVLSLNWKLLAPYFSPGVENPFAIFMLPGYVRTSSPSDPLYRKSWWDIPFIAYYIIIFSFFRESLALKVSRPLAKYFGIRNVTKTDRFAEQTYALIYWSIFGAWGYVRVYVPILYISHLDSLAGHVATSYLLVQHCRFLGRSV